MQRVTRSKTLGPFPWYDLSKVDMHHPPVFSTYASNPTVEVRRTAEHNGNLLNRKVFTKSPPSHRSANMRTCSQSRILYVGWEEAQRRDGTRASRWGCCLPTSPHYFCKRSITLMSSLLLLVILQQAGRSAVMDDCESKVGSELWPSRHLAGKGEEDGRRKLSEVAGMLGSMLQMRGICNYNGEKKSRLHGTMMWRERE
jgi:hypothetical protein